MTSGRLHVPKIIFILPAILALLIKGIASPKKTCLVYSLRPSWLQQYYQISSKTSKTRLSCTEIILALKSPHIMKKYGVNSLKRLLCVLHCCISTALHDQRPVNAARAPCVLRPYYDTTRISIMKGSRELMSLSLFSVNQKPIIPGWQAQLNHWVEGNASYPPLGLGNWGFITVRPGAVCWATGYE